MLPPANYFCFELFDWFFRACRQFAYHSRKIIENLQFAVQMKIFPQNTFFALPPPSLGSVAQTRRKISRWVIFLMSSSHVETKDLTSLKVAGKSCSMEVFDSQMGWAWIVFFKTTLYTSQSNATVYLLLHLRQFHHPLVDLADGPSRDELDEIDAS